jgi:leader peptidase (prepilin peptidase)/N-methyltransferase
MALGFGLFGLIIGSFLNVLVLRSGVLTLGGRSQCMSCGARIAWYDNIPVLSWLLLRGRCRACGSPISIQYPLVEGTTGIVFAFIGGSSHLTDHASAGGVFLAILACVIAALLIAIAVYDLRHTIIPDAWVYVFAVLAIVYVCLGQAFSSIPLLVLGGPLAALPLFLLWFVSRGRWMGLGDVKLALGIGWLLGIMNGIFAVFLAFILGALVGLPLLIVSSSAWHEFIARFIPTYSSRRPFAKVTMKSEIPFGPFLVASCIIVWLSLRYGIEPLMSLGLMPLW